jgi:RNA polymerase sigma-70 factor (ECF subfamily)
MTRVAVPALSDEQLCDLLHAVAVNRDREAFSLLFQYYAPKLKAFGLRQGSTVAAAEELAQEAMLTVWKKADTFNRRLATASTWVFTIVRNKRIDMFRRQRRPEVELDDRFDAPSADAGPDETLAAARSGEAVRAAMLGLPEEQRQVLHKAFFEDKSHSEIAAELELPLGTVKSRIRLALGRLRVQLPGEAP